MKRTATLKTCLFGFFVFVMQNASAQLQLDKSFELTGAFPNNQIIGAGALGIGTLTPAHKIDVVGGDINVSSGFGFRINGAAPSGQYLRGDGTRFVSSAISVSDIPSGSGSYIQNQVGTDQSAGFRISGNGLFSSGSVGIGTLSPASKLDVGDGAITLSGALANQHGIVFERGAVLPASATQASVFQEWNGIGGSSESLTFRSDNYKFQNYDGTDEVIFRGGRVGIGNTSPGSPLTVSHEDAYSFPHPGTQAKGAINIRMATSNRQSGITFSAANSDNAQAGIYVHQDNSAGTHMYFATTGDYSTGPQTWMTILNSGRVGIGTLNPVSKLDVSDGVLSLSGSAGNQHGIVFDRGAGVLASAGQGSIFQELNGVGGNSESLTFRSDNFKFQNYDGTEEVIFRGGRVGIGNTNPGTPLTVSHEGSYSFPTPGSQAKGAINIRMSTSNRQSGITFSQAGTDDAQAGIYVHQDGSAGTHMYLATTGDYSTGPQAWMTIRNNGRIGVGTVNPQSTMHIRTASISSFLGGAYGNVTLDAPYNVGYFMPIDFLSTPDALPAVRIAAQMNNFGSCLVTGTSSSYAAGITNYGMVLDHVGNMAVGHVPAAYSYRLDVNGHTRTIGLTNTSDARFKKNVEPLSNSLGKLTQLQGVSYHWKKDEFPEINFDDRKQVGFIAQDLEKVLPDAVHIDNKGYYSVNYISLIPMLVEGMKEQQKQIDNQQVQINKLLEQNKALLESLNNQ